ncbi:hypothetical protein [Salegentibacter agarivorans]|nr:hypothetical protein [Salegentibacter agarivorans]
MKRFRIFCGRSGMEGGGFSFVSSCLGMKLFSLEVRKAKVLNGM